MKIEVAIDKRALFVFAVLAAVIGSVFVYATTPNPGHDASTVGSGSTTTTYGGSSTFAGSADDIFFFPGRISSGENANPAAGGNGGPRNLYVKDSGPWSGIGIESTGFEPNSPFDSHTYIDFLHGEQVKARIDYAATASGGSLLINADQRTSGTNVGIGMTPVSEKLEVAGNVKASGLCIGSDCRTDWQSAPYTLTVLSPKSAGPQSYTGYTIPGSVMQSYCGDADGCTIDSMSYLGSTLNKPYLLTYFSLAFHLYGEDWVATRSGYSSPYNYPVPATGLFYGRNRDGSFAYDNYVGSYGYLNQGICLFGDYDSPGAISGSIDSTSDWVFASNQFWGTNPHTCTLTIRD